MEAKKTFTTVIMCLGVVFWAANACHAAPMGTAFTYQGHLYDNNEAADGLYDFRFRLYDGNDPCDSNQIGSDVNKPNLDVIDGYFTAESHVPQYLTRRKTSIF